jgi:hypothetical protein
MSSLSVLDHINMLSALSPNRGERIWVQDILDGWEDDGYPRLTPLLKRPLPPFPRLEVFLPTEGKMVESHMCLALMALLQKAAPSPVPSWGQTPHSLRRVPYDQARLLTLRPSPDPGTESALNHTP